MCVEWRDSFEAFLRDMGDRPDGQELDRIDNDGPYAPGNCRWTTRKEQTRNRSCAIRIEWNGIVRTLPEWAEVLGLNYDMLKRRYQKGWEPERMLTQPAGDRTRTQAAYRLTQPPFSRFHPRRKAS